MTASKYFIRKDIKKPFFFGHCAAAGAIKPLRNRRMTASKHVLLSPLGACQQTVYCCAMTHPQLLHPEARERRTTDSSTNSIQNCFCLYSQLRSLCFDMKTQYMHIFWKYIFYWNKSWVNVHDDDREGCHSAGSYAGPTMRRQRTMIQQQNTLVDSILCQPWPAAGLRVADSQLAMGRGSCLRITTVRTHSCTAERDRKFQRLRHRIREEYVRGNVPNASAVYQVHCLGGGWRTVSLVSGWHCHPNLRRLSENWLSASKSNTVLK